tara:strand:- start:349 stop:705 length:357 start_codon:yes stop_codon:yes gene_type:complete
LPEESPRPHFRYSLPKGVSSREFEDMLETIDFKDWIFHKSKGLLIRGMMGMALYRYEDEGEWFSSKSLVTFLLDMESRTGAVNTSHYRITSLMRQIVRASPSYIQKHTPNGILFRKTI